VHSECEALRSHALPVHGTYLAMIVPALVLGFGGTSSSVYGWIAMCIVIVGGSGLIWWVTERAWGKFS
jgi:hypothetical protein